ncbi:M24 family metallopeptidase [Flavitalea flava]
MNLPNTLSVEDDTKYKLTFAQGKAKELFEAIGEGGFVVAGKSESELIGEIVGLAREGFGIEAFWHKKIVRAGINTLQPYSGNPPDLVIQEDDIVIVDFGPIVYGHEADVARTFVLGHDPLKLKIKRDTEAAWQQANAWFGERRGEDCERGLTGAAFYEYIIGLAARYGYEYGGEIAGHIVGPFPHEQLGPGNWGLDIHPENRQDMFGKDSAGNSRHWILEMHFIDRANGVGAFFEQLLT